MLLTFELFFFFFFPSKLDSINFSKLNRHPDTQHTLKTKMKKIKGFIEKKRTDSRFKKAGEGIFGFFVVAVVVVVVVGVLFICLFCFVLFCFVFVCFFYNLDSKNTKKFFVFFGYVYFLVYLCFKSDKENLSAVFFFLVWVGFREDIDQ